ncbi:MAG: PAS domain S-box protein [Syntrophorhabdaceae bacterium]
MAKKVLRVTGGSPPDIGNESFGLRHDIGDLSTIMLETLPALFVAIEEDGSIRMMNDFMLKTLGYTSSEIIGKNYLTTIVVRDDRELVSDVFRLLATENYPTLNENRILSKSGEEILVEWRGRFIRKPDGELDYIFGIGIDVTDRNRMENELKAHRDHLNQLVLERTREIEEEIARRKDKDAQYQSLVESIIEWVWETDSGFVFTYLSPRIYDVLGYRSEELTGLSPSDLMPPGERRKAMPVIRKVIAQKAEFVNFQTVHIDKDGRYIFVEANGKPFFDETGKLLGYRGSARDITEQKRFVDALKEREAELTIKSITLEEVNAALKILLQQREHDRKDLEEKFISNVKVMVLPYIQRIIKSGLDPKYQTYLDVAIANLNEIMSPFLTSLKYFNFTPKEIEVATLIRDGKTTKEIAAIIGVAVSAIHSHRDNVRKKLDLNNKKINLRTFLLSLK